jgi:hypothetical protein
MRNRLTIAVPTFSLLPNALARSQIKNPKTGQSPPGKVRAPHSKKADLAISICLGQFEDGLIKNGIAFRGEDGVVLPSVSNLSRQR